MHSPYSPSIKLVQLQKRRKMAISLTPLIDVVFILLVFFMLASSFMEWQVIPMDLSANGEKPSIQSEASEAIIVVQVRGSQILFEGKLISTDELIVYLQELESIDSVHVQPLGDTQVQDIIQVLDELSAAKIELLQLIDDPQWLSNEGEMNAFP